MTLTASSHTTDKRKKIPAVSNDVPRQCACKAYWVLTAFLDFIDFPKSLSEFLVTGSLAAQQRDDEHIHQEESTRKCRELTGHENGKWQISLGHRQCCTALLSPLHCYKLGCNQAHSDLTWLTGPLSDHRHCPLLGSAHRICSWSSHSFIPQLCIVQLTTCCWLSPRQTQLLSLSALLSDDQYYLYHHPFISGIKMLQHVEDTSMWG